MKRQPHTTTLRERRKNRAESLSFGRTATELQKRQKKYTRSQRARKRFQQRKKS